MMKRGKGICAAVLMGLIGGMTGAVVSASADAGGRDHAAARAAVTAGVDATPNGHNSDPGSTRGAGGSGGGGSDSGNSSPSSQVGSFGGGDGNAQGGPHSRGSGGDPNGGTGGRDGSSTPPGGSTGSGTSSQRSHGGSGPVSSGWSGGSQGSGASPGRGSSSSGGGNTSSASGGGNAIGGQSGRCNSGCNVAPQQGTTGTPKYASIPNQSQSPSTPVTPATTPTTPTTPTPSTTQPGTTPQSKPKHGFPTSTTYRTSATPVPAAGHTLTAGVVGLGATVSPGLRAGSTPTGSGLPVGTPGSIANLLGTPPAIQSSTQSGDRSRGVPPRTTVVTQPISQHTIIQSLEEVVPPGIWIALAAALAFGALGTGWALYSGHRVRLQAGAFAAMSTAALTDQLTGILNRRGFLEAVERELARARRYDRGFVLAYVDVRGLKGVNDTEGHRAGDELLKEAASLLQDSARADDVVGRLGGDEMGLLLVEQGAEGAEVVRRRVAAQIPSRREKLGLHSSWDLTIGTAAYPEDGETVDDLLRVADLRLYEQRGIDLIERTPA